MTKQEIMSCDLHDYLEIACMYKIRVEMTLADGQKTTGIPLTTRVTSEKEELLVFQVSDKERIELPLLSLQKMTAMSNNPHFNTVGFRNS